MAVVEDSDPFLEVQLDVQSLLTQTRHLFSSYLRIRTINPNPSSPELIQSRNEVLTNLNTLRADLEDLVESIKAVENDPYRFGLDVAEVQRRRHFVDEVGGEMQSMSKEISSGTTAAGGAAVGNKDASGSNALPNPSAFEERHDFDGYGDDEDGDAYAEFEAQQQVTMMREQDSQLDDIQHTVGRLRGQAADMGRELEEQAGILDEVENVADRVGGKLQGGLKKVGEVIRRNEETYSSCCIGVLILVLIILLILLIII